MKPLILLLEELVNFADASSEEPRWADSMRNMLDRHGRGKLSIFTAKQKAYIAETHEKVFDEPTYRNEFSEGKVALGTALRTAVPDVLKRPLPMKPPGRKP